MTVKHSIQISDWHDDGRVVEGCHFEYGTYVGRYKKGSWWYVNEEKNRAKKHDIVDTVIAWQPLPEPCKGDETMSNIKRICCKDCIFFIKTQNGQRGGIKGKCRIRKPNEKRNGSATACRMFGRLTLDKKENES